MPELDEVRNRLRLPEADAHWYTTWQAAPPADTAVPVLSGDDCARLLRDFGVDDAMIAETVPMLPRPDDEALWWVVERCYRQLAADMGGIGMVKWPSLSHLGTPERFTYLYPLLAVLPRTRRFYSARGIPAEVLHDTMSNLAEKLALNSARFGAPGLDIAFWFSLHVRGALFRLGRLEFAMEVLPTPHPFPGVKAGTLTLGIHIPGHAGPLSREGCVDSIQQAREFFPKYFSERFSTTPMFTCTSWLLDPRLRDFLPTDSNIVSFQDLFSLAPVGSDATTRGKKDVLQFVFNRSGDHDPAELPRDSRLRRHLADGLESGPGWQTRAGWLRS